MPSNGAIVEGCSVTDHQIASDDYRRAADDCLRRKQYDLCQAYLGLAAQYNENIPDSLEMDVDFDQST
jgi:hypothetical protein